MKYSLISSFVALFISSSLAPALGDLLYYEEPSLNFAVHTAPVRRNNGIFLSPGEDLLVSSSNTGTLTALDSINGGLLWSYQPEQVAKQGVLSCTSGVTFVPNTEMMVYSVIIDEGLSNPRSFVVALSIAGEEVWVSDMLDGAASGTPVASGDGNYIFLNHNSGSGSQGHFTIVNATLGKLFYSQKNDLAPFAPPGIYHSPAEGYYDGGESNTNDILVWSVQPKPSDAIVGPGTTFAFQFPIEFTGEATGLNYTQLGSIARDFQSIQKPVLANEGRSLYWGVSRSQFQCWVGVEGLDRLRFSRARTNSAGFTRGNPPGQAVFAPLEMMGDGTDLVLFGGSAAAEFVRLNFDFTDNISFATSSIVTVQARVSPDQLFVYYVEFGGTVHQASTTDLMDSWIHNIEVPVEGEAALALRKDGTILYVADVSGEVQAFQVAELPALPSSSPSESPSQTPSFEPSERPSTVPSMTPSIQPTIAQSASPTMPPTRLPTAAPTKAPSTGAPSFNPTAQPVLSEESISEESSDPDSEEFDPELEEASDCGRAWLSFLGGIFVVQILVVLF